MYWQDADRLDGFVERDRRAGSGDPTRYAHRADEYRSYSAGACCCASFLLVVGVGTIALARRYRATTGA